MKPITQSKRQKGISAEQTAVNYLKRTGYRILERNYRKRIGEIDIIAAKENTVVFVEVKSLQSESLLVLGQTISALKKQKLVKICQYWLTENDKANYNWRIDFIGLVVDIRGRLKKLKHLQNAIY
ncbi:MAG TPA: YraN family protein [Candidatus Dojkabacteria bacterium]|nr:YraN family protein [Candidatus Dojkabacteria bacterium]